MPLLMVLNCPPVPDLPGHGERKNQTDTPFAHSSRQVQTESHTHTPTTINLLGQDQRDARIDMPSALHTLEWQSLVRNNPNIGHKDAGSGGGHEELADGRGGQVRQESARTGLKKQKPPRQSPGW